MKMKFKIRDINSDVLLSNQIDKIFVYLSSQLTQRNWCGDFLTGAVRSLTVLQLFNLFVYDLMLKLLIFSVVVRIV